jgi:hypothetical protein
MKHLLAEAGFDIDRICTDSWGNSACMRAILSAQAGRVLAGDGQCGINPNFRSPLGRLPSVSESSSRGSRVHAKSSL